jgi:hypothetical protein
LEDEKLKEINYKNLGENIRSWNKSCLCYIGIKNLGTLIPGVIENVKTLINYS